jgi:hypothetical protein
MTYKLIETVTVTGSPTVGISFSSIPSTYTDLELICSTNGSANTGVNINFLTYNGDTNTTGYSGRYLDTGGTGTPRGNAWAGPSVYEWASTTYTNLRVSSRIYIPNYTNTSSVKTWFTDTVTGGNFLATYNALTMGVGKSGATAAISSLSVYGNSSQFAVGSTISLYGIG